ncbi:MAG: serine hydrolase domain-containing protein, partial [Nitrospiria bacterium]
MNDPIAQKMKEGVLAGVFPGGVLLVHHRGRIVFHKAFGSASLTPKRKSMTCSTLFGLASLTKPLATSAALALLLQRRCLALSDPLSRFIRGFKSGEKGGITLFHLLNHASGLPDWRPYYQVIAKRGEKEKGFVGSDAAKEAIYRMAHREPLISAPGTESRYSDIGFILLGEVIEKVGGEPLHRFCYRHL